MPKPKRSHKHKPSARTAAVPPSIVASTVALEQAVRQAAAACQRSDWAEAEKQCRIILDLKADHFDALYLLGIVAARNRHTQEAADLLSRALSVNPNHAEANHGYAAALVELRQLDAAVEYYERTIALQPDYADAYFKRGNALRALKRDAPALTSYRTALALRPDHAHAHYNCGNLLQKLRRFEEALAAYGRAIALKQDFAEAYNNRAAAFEKLGHHVEALSDYEHAATLKPDYADAHYNRGNMLCALGRDGQGLASYERAIALKPRYAKAHGNRAAALAKLNRNEEALAGREQVLALTPADADAHYNLGNALRALARHGEALASYERALALAPEFAQAYGNRGNALRDLQRFDVALASYERARALAPLSAEACSNCGNALRDLRRQVEALAAYEQAVALAPDYAEAYHNCGVANSELARPEAARASYERSLALRPDYAAAYSGRGVALARLRRHTEALTSYEQALALQPDYPEASNNRGAALAELRRYAEALASYEQALAGRPDYAEAYNNLGIALGELTQYSAAIENFGRAIALRPDHADAYYNRGNTLRDLRRYDQALTSYDLALLLDPRYAYLYGLRLHLKMLLCDWRDLDAELSELAARIERNEKATIPFAVLPVTDRLPVQSRSAEIWAADKASASLALPDLQKLPRHEKIRIGYFSADFRNHAVSILMAELFERHDKSSFEVYAFAFGPPSDDPLRRRIAAACDRFIDVAAQGDMEVALLARCLELDIAVDLGGYTEGSRTGIFAHRAAPLQLSYLGYLGTMGAQYMDYLIADRTIVPLEQQEKYSEKIVCLPCYQVNDSQRRIADKVFTREELGLPQSGFVYCCFNNNYKITPASFDGWMRILKAVPGSVLFLYADNEFACANLKQEAVARGVDADRLVFGERLPPAEYLARYRAADLFLDTFPYNAGTTASDALWAGLPVLTCMGQAFASRVAASLLTAIDLPELITTTQQDYESLAIALGTDPQRMAAIRRKLAAHRLTAPLFDAQRFARNIESAYRALYERSQAGLAPEHMQIQD